MAALPYRCAECNSQWPENRATCAFCGSTERVANTDAAPVASQRPYAPAARREPDYHPQVSQAPYVAVTLILAALIGVLVWLALRKDTDGAFLYGLIAAAIVAANVWICCLIYITKARVDRIGFVLDDVARTMRQ